MADGYATVSITDVEAADDGGPVGHRSFTGELRCSAVTVDGYHLAPDGTILLPAAQEQVCIPIDADEPLQLGDGIHLPPRGIACVPAGIERNVRCSTATSIAVIGAPVESPTSDTPTVVAFEKLGFDTTSASGIETARLTARLAAEGMKINARILDPGECIPYHTEGQQEELFVPISGPARMRIAGDTYETPIGTITMVTPPVPRSAVNEGETEAFWVMIGAPPTGDPSEWAPGVEIVE